MKHKHYDLILAWANGAEIQLLARDNEWCDIRPQWKDDSTYRIKPKMVKVGRHEWPEPLKELVPYTTVWAVSFDYTPAQELFTSRLVKQAIIEGVAHATREAAEQHRAALRCINVGDID
jgi:hypothetical protein